MREIRFHCEGPHEKRRHFQKLFLAFIYYLNFPHCFPLEFLVNRDIFDLNIASKGRNSRKWGVNFFLLYAVVVLVKP